MLRMSQLHHYENPNSSDDIQSKSNRRKFMQSCSNKAFTAALLATLGTEKASAYDKSFPDNLDFSNMDSPDKQQYKKNQITTQNRPIVQKNNKAEVTEDIVPALTWGLAAWLLSGSRSNPLVTPLANILYDSSDEEKNQWLQDRNDGLFASIPLSLTIILGGVFIGIGILIHKFILILEGEGGDADVSLQLAGVSVIGGAALELGRIASGEKQLTKEDMDRSILLQTEFEEFASKRLKNGGNCHRSEVIRAFRRYFAKYRNAENPQNPEYDVSDLEIERLIKGWSRSMGYQEMSSAGFFTGMQLDDRSDVLLL